MSYSEFTLARIKKEFALHLISSENLFPDAGADPVPADLLNYLNKHTSLALAINTEKARAEWMIAPILAELRFHFSHQISLFSGIEFNIDNSRGLNGRCDFILSLSNEQFFLTAPVLILVEAKNNDLNSGFGQCIAEMIGAQIFNTQQNSLLNEIYGVVTTGSLWRFLKLNLNNKTVWIDRNEYSLQLIDRLFWVFRSIIEHY